MHIHIKLALVGLLYHIHWTPMHSRRAGGYHVGKLGKTSRFTAKSCGASANNFVVIIFSLITFLDAPDVETRNSLLELFDIDSTLTLMCSFEGVPLPLLVWMHNGLSLSNSNASTTITNTSDLSNGTSTLQWVNVSPDTVGTFTCVATNSLGSADRSINVQIRSKFFNLLMSVLCHCDFYSCVCGSVLA